MAGRSGIAFSDHALEIGNRIWTDTDNDGIQDADGRYRRHRGQAVQEWYSGGTDHNSQWRTVVFQCPNVTMNGAAGLEYDMDYIIRVESGDFL
ncbi:MAG: hypothetical protein R2787_04550 [Saprospiraceae bacterium]